MNELYKLAHDYHILTEEYDRLVCTGPITEMGIRPANSKEVAKCSLNAKRVWDELYSRVQSNYSREEWRDAIHYWADRYKMKLDEEIDRALVDTLNKKFGYKLNENELKGKVSRRISADKNTDTYYYEDDPLFVLTHSREFGKMGWLITKFY
jgi:hypothetical protein